MYPIAIAVQSCLQAGTRAEIAWTVASTGVGPRPAAEAIVFTPGGGRVGTVLGGALDERLAEHAHLVAKGAGRLVELEIGHVEALVSGLEPGGTVHAMVAPATALPAALWPALVARRPLALVAHLQHGELVGTEVFTEDTVDAAPAEVGELMRRRTSATAILGDQEGSSVITVLWPDARLVLAGGGDYADAIAELAAWLGWQVERVSDPVTAAALAAALGPGDAAVACGHEHEIVGATLQAALHSGAGYVGALGAPRVRRERELWLSERGTTDLTRLHTPAGLDIGSREPREVALSVMADLYAAQRGASGRPLALTEQTGTAGRGEQPSHGRS